MKRNRNLIQHILAYLEDREPNPELKTHTSIYNYIDLPKIDGFTKEQIAVHLVMCKEAGWLMDYTTGWVDLSWQGHDELDRLREDPAELIEMGILPEPDEEEVG